MPPFPEELTYMDNGEIIDADPKVDADALLTLDETFCPDGFGEALVRRWNAHAKLVQALQLTAGALGVIARSYNVPDGDLIIFTGKWKNLGQMTLGQVFDLANAGLAHVPEPDKPAHDEIEASLSEQLQKG